MPQPKPVSFQNHHFQICFSNPLFMPIPFLFLVLPAGKHVSKTPLQEYRKGRVGFPVMRGQGSALIVPKKPRQFNRSPYDPTHRRLPPIHIRGRAPYIPAAHFSEAPHWRRRNEAFLPQEVTTLPLRAQIRLRLQKWEPWLSRPPPSPKPSAVSQVCLLQIHWLGSCHEDRDCIRIVIWSPMLGAEGCQGPGSGSSWRSQLPARAPRLAKGSPRPGRRPPTHWSGAGRSGRGSAPSPARPSPGPSHTGKKPRELLPGAGPPVPRHHTLSLATS